ncbi:MAG: ATP-binding protein, partial [Bacteroidales bacterium]|nr:ATP-binding protein [Bacteroidales bacterium]
MIIQFSIENYLSFKSQNILSLVSTPLREDATLTENVQIPVADTDVTLLKSALILGSNASGKSNVIKAFDFFKRFIIGSFKDVQAGEVIPVESFRLDVKSASEPSSFELIFISSGNQFRYGFTVSREEVKGEWLYRKFCRKRAKEVELFFREDGRFQVHPTMSLIQDIVNRKMVRPNALLLSAAAQFNDPTAVEIIGWLDDTAIISCSEDEDNWKEALRHFDDERMRNRIVRFSQYADLGIEDIEKTGDRVISRHNQYGENGEVVRSVAFPFLANESEGTVKYFSLAFPIIDALDHGKRLIVDEFDSKMHPNLTERVISLFNSKET